MSVWMNPQKLYSYNLTANDVINAIGAQNIQIPWGSWGTVLS